MGTAEIQKRQAFYGGSFDPVHIGHVAIARALIERFELDEFVFVPAFHAPHKPHSKPVSSYHRFAMLSLATSGIEKATVSTIELEAPEKPYTIETQTRLLDELPDTEIFFVIGADSWEEITTWRRWEEVLTLVNIIVVTRPGHEIGFEHVTELVRERVVDLRQESGVRSQESEVRGQEAGEGSPEGTEASRPEAYKGPVRDSLDVRDVSPQSSVLSPRPSVLSPRIFLTDLVNIAVSATEIRRKIREGDPAWGIDVPESVLEHIIKHSLYR